MSLDRCRLCHRPLALIARYGAWCTLCASEQLADGVRAATLPEAVRLVLADMCTDAGLFAWARALAGAGVPFDGERDGR